MSVSFIPHPPAVQQKGKVKSRAARRLLSAVWKSVFLLRFNLKWFIFLSPTTQSLLFCNSRRNAEIQTSWWLSVVVDFVCSLQSPWGCQCTTVFCEILIVLESWFNAQLGSQRCWRLHVPFNHQRKKLIIYHRILCVKFLDSILLRIVSIAFGLLCGNRNCVVELFQETNVPIYFQGVQWWIGWTLWIVKFTRIPHLKFNQQKKIILTV